MCGDCGVTVMPQTGSFSGKPAALEGKLGSKAILFSRLFLLGKELVKLGYFLLLRRNDLLCHRLHFG